MPYQARRKRSDFSIAAYACIEHANSIVLADGSSCPGWRVTKMWQWRPGVTHGMRVATQKMRAGARAAPHRIAVCQDAGGMGVALATPCTPWNVKVTRHP
jgi:hypothetical protein